MGSDDRSERSRGQRRDGDPLPDLRVEAPEQVGEVGLAQRLLALPSFTQVWAGPDLRPVPPRVQRAAQIRDQP
jgi:hypothetical protein